MNSQDSKSTNFFSNLLATLFNSNNPEARKKKQLKSIAKKLSKTHTKFYSLSADEALPALAKLFYNIYKTIAPIQTMFQNTSKDYLKFFIIDYLLNDKQKKILEDLSSESIHEQAKNTPLPELIKKINHEKDTLMTFFNDKSIETINALYDDLMIFKSFCSFDYYFLLKKFDSALQESQFNAVPHFEKINAEYLADDLRDFSDVLYALPINHDWENLFKVFKNMKGTEPVSLSNWNKIYQKMISYQKTEVFVMLTQLILKDPTWTRTISEQNNNIIDPYIQKITKETEKTLIELKNEQNKSKADSMLIQIFGTNVVLRQKFYTEQFSTKLETKGLNKLLYYNPLHYLKAFILDFVKTEIREFSDMVLIRGQWSNNALSTSMSTAYNSLIEMSTQITQFDEALAEEGAIGIKIKTNIIKIGRDKEARNIIQTIIKDANEAAYVFIKQGTENLVTIGKMIKPLLEDYEKKSPSLILNWKELEHFAEHPIKQLGIDCYKRIYLFISLMKIVLTERN